MAERRTGAGIGEHLLLLGRFLRSPRTVGAVAPSSRALALAMVEGLPFDRAERVIELGPGTGVFTAAIVERLASGARLLAVDVDQMFVDRIRARWPSVTCVCASAERLQDLAAEHHMRPADHVLSGLPFVSLPAPVTRGILDAVTATLKPGGTFTTFQYVHAFGWPSATAFRRAMSERMAGPPQSRLVMRNVPPAFALTWTKG